MAKIKKFNEDDHKDMIKTDKGFKDFIKEQKGLKLKSEGILKIESKEDGGQALISEYFPFKTLDSDDENGMFAIIQSWDEDTVHSDIQKFIGKKVRVTIEII